ncbi:conserved hypothetical protein [Pseudomonas sp. 8Z]|uniref:IS66 family insertion sequence element accessory protein TnpB n=1 Tax=Pseudomonas sp. 8Z TaxID=2653166 RepID=UPI0012F18E8E|nr:IS66 family insertion sequence element accessory protein TnpB [Pseudomonas sp. 8Z]VXD05042.1 conserved hypothetical protein [Pseudomonas sp. 8Z]
MMRPDAKVQKLYLYPKPVDFRKSINGLVELDIKVEVFNPVLFVFLNRTRSQVKSSNSMAFACDSSAWRPSISRLSPMSEI